VSAWLKDVRARDHRADQRDVRRLARGAFLEESHHLRVNLSSRSERQFVLGGNVPKEVQGETPAAAAISSVVTAS
jgi:hypothetical protein